MTSKTMSCAIWRACVTVIILQSSVVIVTQQFATTVLTPPTTESTPSPLTSLSTPTTTTTASTPLPTPSTSTIASTTPAFGSTPTSGTKRSTTSPVVSSSAIPIVDSNSTMSTVTSMPITNTNNSRLVADCTATGNITCKNMKNANLDEITTGVIIGIVIGCLIALILVIVIIVVCVRWITCCQCPKKAERSPVNMRVSLNNTVTLVMENTSFSNHINTALKEDKRQLIEMKPQNGTLLSMKNDSSDTASTLTMEDTPIERNKPVHSIIDPMYATVTLPHQKRTSAIGDWEDNYSNLDDLHAVQNHQWKSADKSSSLLASSPSPASPVLTTSPNPDVEYAVVNKPRKFVADTIYEKRLPNFLNVGESGCPNRTEN